MNKAKSPKPRVKARKVGVPDDTRILGPLESAPLTVLLVDDDDDTRRIIASQLQQIGINLIESDSGTSALEVLRKTRVDLVVSDLVMPHMSGMMLLHSMLEQGIHAPFILVTGFSDKDSAIQALRLGAFDYLEKPVDFTDLNTVVREALKLSTDQREILRRITPEPSMEGEAPAAQLHIMKMRALRGPGESMEMPSSPGPNPSWLQLRDLFVAEAEPQLIFAEGAVRTLLEGESVTRDVAFALRVVQSVRLAAEALRVNDIATFAWSIESSLAACKLAPTHLKPEHVEIFINATRILRDKIAALVSPEIAQKTAKLDEIAESMRRLARLGKLSA